MLTGHAKRDYQREYMRRRRAAAADGKGPTKRAPDTERLEAENARLKARIAELEAKLAQERHARSAGLDPALTRRLRAALHPDNAQHPQGRAALHQGFVKVSDLLKEAAKARPFMSRDELLRRGREEHEKRSRQSKAAAAKRKANAEGRT